MIKIVLKVQGMMCPHCEAAVAKAVQGAVKAESVVPSHKRGTTEVVCADSVDAGVVKAAIEAAGYPVTAVSVRKKGIFGLWV